MSYPVEIGRNIVALRRAQGKTQEDLEELSKVSVSRLRAIEHGTANVRIDTLERIADALGVSCHTLSILHMEDETILDMMRQARERLCAPAGAQESPGL